MVKFFAILCVLISAVLTCQSIYSMPPVGVVTGICRDLKTGQPVADASIDIDLDQSNDQDSNDSGGSNSSTSTSIFNALPTGWAQGSQSDTALDLSGHDSSPKTSWMASTDDSGRFCLRNVTAGTYTVSANASGYDDASAPLAVAELINEPITITMKRSAPTLTFDTPGKYWATSDSPSLGLNGSLAKPALHLELDSLNIDQAIAICPKLLLQDEQSVDSSKVQSTVVRRWDITIADADSGGIFYDQIRCGDPVTGRLPAGLYRITASSIFDRGVSSSVVFVVTDLAVMGKQYGSTLLLDTVGLTNGNAISGLSCVCLVDSSGGPTVLSSGVSRANGICSLSTAGSASESTAMAIIRRGNSAAALETNLNSPGFVDENSGENESVNPAARALRSFIYTDRPVYRPGQTVQMRGISRWYLPGSGYAVPAGTKFELSITDAQNTVVNRQTVTANQYGSWAAYVTLSGEALTGGYTITESSGDLNASGSFSVAVYHKPEYSVTVTFDKQRYVRGDTIVATVAGRYYFGAPMNGANCSVQYFSNSTANADEGGSGNSDDGGTFNVSKSLTLDGNGSAKIEIPTRQQDPSEQSITYNVSATVDDNSGQSVTTEATVVVAQGDFSITATPSSTVASIGDSVSVTAQALDSSGLPITGKQLKVSADYDVWKDDRDIYTPISSDNLTTNADGTANFVVKPEKAGLVDFKFEGTDDHGNAVTEDTQVWIPDKNEDIPEQYSDLSVVLGKPKYVPGGTARVLITTAHPGPDALITVEGLTLYQTIIVPLVRRATEVDIPVKEAYAPGVTVEAECIVNKQCLSSSASMTIDDPERSLKVTVSTDKPTYHPGDKAKVDIHTTDAKGRPVSADVSVGVVDSAIYSIMPDQSGSIIDAFLPAQDNEVLDSDSTQVVYYGDVDKGSTDFDIRR